MPFSFILLLFFYLFRILVVVCNKLWRLKVNIFCIYENGLNDVDKCFFLMSLNIMAIKKCMQKALPPILKIVHLSNPEVSYLLPPSLIGPTSYKDVSRPCLVYTLSKHSTYEPMRTWRPLSVHVHYLYNI